MNAPSKFNLKTAIEQAEAGDSALWEDIARYLLAQKSKKAKPKSTGSYAYASVLFQDGVMVLVGGYGLDPTSDAALQKATRLRAGVMSGRWFDPAWLKKIPRAIEARAIASDELESCRETAFRQRIEGWGKYAWSTVFNGNGWKE